MRFVIMVLFQDLLPVFVAMLFSITLRSFFHVSLAARYGDRTPFFLGRYSINPLKNIDLMGSVIMVMHFFGWNRMVPLDFKKYQHRSDLFKVLMSGVMANLLGLLFFSLIYWVLKDGIQANVKYILKIACAGIILNFNMIFVNLLPLPVSDLGRFVFPFLRQHPLIEFFGKLLIFILVVFFNTPLKELSAQGLGFLYSVDLYAVVNSRVI